MIAALSAIRDEYAAALDGVIRVYTNPPATPTMPCLIVGFPTRIEPTVNLAGHGRYEIPLTALVALADVDSAGHDLDSILTGPIVSSLQTHTSTVWQAFAVENWTDLGPVPVGNGQALSATLNTVLIA